MITTPILAMHGGAGAPFLGFLLILVVLAIVLNWDRKTP